MLARRKFLSLIGVASTVGPMAAKTAADKAVADLAGVSLGVSGSGMMRGMSNADATSAQVRSAFAIPGFRKQIEEMLYEENRSVHHIDVDLAVHRSFSLSAKITFQRQRIVANEIRRLESGWSWDRVQNAIAGVLGLKWPSNT